MSRRLLNYASPTTPRRSRGMDCLLGFCDAALGAAVLLAVPLGMILASVLLLLEFWLAGGLAILFVPAVIIGGLKLSDAIRRARQHVSG